MMLILTLSCLGLTGTPATEAKRRPPSQFNSSNRTFPSAVRHRFDHAVEDCEILRCHHTHQLRHSGSIPILNSKLCLCKLSQTGSCLYLLFIIFIVKSTFLWLSMNICAFMDGGLLVGLSLT